MSLGRIPEPPYPEVGQRISKAEAEIEQICKESGGRNQFFVYGSSGYKDSVRHYFQSSAESAHSAVQPGSVEDLSQILRVLAKWDVPFAIKGGGHATNPKFSSTTGIQIYMCKFDQVTYNQATQTVDVGAGCLWDQVYITLEKYYRSAVGGATSAGVGVAGYLLGGGYSIKTNQYGLGIDNIVKFQVVLPDGRILEVEENDPALGDLFIALKGGGSNFGIVTRFTLKTHEQGSCWTSGTDFIFPESMSGQAKHALVNFSQNEKRPKASIYSQFRHYYEKRKLKLDLEIYCFYDGFLPTDDDDPFKEFKEIKQGDAQKGRPLVIGFQSESFLEAYKYLTGNGPKQKPLMSGVSEVARGRFACIMVKRFTLPLVDEIEKQIKKSGESMVANGGVQLIIDIWPFLPTIFDKSPEAAWPHRKGRAIGPVLAWYTWEDEENDTFWLAEMKRALEAIKDVADAEGCTLDGAPVYLNNSLGDTDVQDIYRENYSRLVRTKMKYDPGNVMKNTGGFQIL